MVVSGCVPRGQDVVLGVQIGNNIRAVPVRLAAGRPAILQQRGWWDDGRRTLGGRMDYAAFCAENTPHALGACDLRAGRQRTVGQARCGRAVLA
jgi:hypothetical protein